MEAKIGYHCVAKDHRDREGVGPDRLTVHEGKWAYCPHDARADGHDWRPEAGLPLSKSNMRESRLAEGSRPASDDERATRRR